MKVNYKHSIVYVILALLLLIPIFGFLGGLPIRLWDESRLAVSAYEMSKNGNFMTPYFEGTPDFWSTKPPLMLWCQVFFIKLIGANEIAIRLPSAIATFLTCALLIFFAVKYLKNIVFGFASVLILMTSLGYVHYHISRTGDYDAMLTFFTTFYALSFFAFSESKKKKFLYFFFIGLTLSVLTKGVAGLLFLPALFLYSLFQKQVLAILKSKHTYIGIGIFVFFVLGYYLLRESQTPGYIKAVCENELGGRYLETLEGHKHPFLYYYDNLRIHHFATWFLFLPVGILIGLFSKDDKIKKLTLFSFTVALTYLFAISLGSTKLEWYAAPLYPFFAVLTAFFVLLCFNFLKENNFFKKSLRFNIIPFVFLFLLFISPYQAVINKTYKPKEYSWDEESHKISYYLRDGLKGKTELNHFFIANDGYAAHLRFYINLLNDKGIQIDFKNWKKLNSGDKVLVHQANVNEYIQANYNYEILSQEDNIVKYCIKSGKND